MERRIRKVNKDTSKAEKRLQQEAGQRLRRKLEIGPCKDQASFEEAVEVLVGYVTGKMRSLTNTLNSVARTSHKSLNDANDQRGHIPRTFEECHANTCIEAKEALKDAS